MSDAISVLLIDGNDRDRERYAQQLRACSSQYDVAQAATGQAGLNHYARQPIDCVVVEIDLPDMSGFQVLASLVSSASRPETAVVVYTSLSNPYLLELALKNGARAALRKIAPVNSLLDRSILDAISSVKNDRERRNGQRLSFIL
jgi:DNA-binding NarL/FixJ family response regulator